MNKDSIQNNSKFLWQEHNLAESTKGQWVSLNSTISSRTICTDTRKISKGDIFLAIKGENFDGHEYIETAKQQGAVACIVSEVSDIDIPQLQVSDTKLALGDLGKFVRDSHPNLKVVALTGSMGKTTVKEMLGCILSQKAPTLITRGNLNNDLGVPMMLLEIEDNHEYAVLELGANHLGEIAYTSEMVDPQVACVLNIGTAHLGEFGGRDNICRAKSEIFSSLNNSDVAIIPAQDDFTEQLRHTAHKFTNKIVTFGTNASTKILAENINTSTFQSEFILTYSNIESHEKCDDRKVTLNFAGKHNIYNALAAATCADALGFSLVEIAVGLNKASPPKGRLNPIQFGKHLLIDDTYNANPDAVLTATDVLVKATEEIADTSDEPTKSILVLGDIGELGEQAIVEHNKLGEKLTGKRVDYIFCLGDLMQHCAQTAKNSNPKAHHFMDKSKLLAELQRLMQTYTVVALFKGSRFMTMESLIKDITS